METKSNKKIEERKIEKEEEGKGMSKTQRRAVQIKRERTVNEKIGEAKTGKGRGNRENEKGKG